MTVPTPTPSTPATDDAAAAADDAAAATRGTATATDHLLAGRWPLHASLSPDGTRLLLTTTEIAPGATDETISLTLVQVADGTESPVPVVGVGHSAVWAPDGQGLAWCVDLDDGTSVVVVADAVDGTARLLESSRGVVAAPEWSPDGTRLAVVARRGTVLDRTQPHRWTRPIAWFDGLGPLEDPPQVRLVDIATDTSRWLTDDDWRWSMPRWAPDGTRLSAIAGTDPTGQHSGQHVRFLTVAPADDGTVAPPEPAPVTSGRSASAIWLPDGRLAVVVAEPRAKGLASDAELWIVGPDGTRQVPIDWLVGDIYGDSPAVLAEHPELLVLTAGDTELVLRCGANGRMWVSRLDLAAIDGAAGSAGVGGSDGAITPTVVADGQRACAPVGVAGHTVVITTQSAGEPAELAVVDATGTERRLTTFGAAAMAAVPRVDLHRFQLRTAEGWPLDGWYAAPAGTTGPLPTVLVIHGGPHFAFGEMFSLDVHQLCAAGFGVVYTNPRGSVGCGQAFAQACIGDWTDGPARDLFTVLDHTIAQGWADPQRLAVAGLSYGGYMSAWLAATTTRFRAAVIENPVTDLASMWAISDIGISYFEASFGGAPHQVPEVYRAQSPLWRAHECTTPCLWVVGDHDRRCPPSQAWGMHRVLHTVGTPSEVVVLPGASHDGSTYGSPAVRRAQNAAMVDWLHRWL
jgi:dipeptidyl aminopeptidase/acylaminoacyl peptidase